MISNLVAYVLGHSDLQTVLIASAIRIAQCMGMDKQEDILSNTRAYDSLTWEKRVEREVVRRVWWQLIIQDYFEIAFSNAYSMNSPIELDGLVRHYSVSSRQAASTKVLSLSIAARISNCPIVVHPDRCSTPLPANCDDLDLEELPIDHPTISSYTIALAKGDS